VIAVAPSGLDHFKRFVPKARKAVDCQDMVDTFLS